MIKNEKQYQITIKKRDEFIKSIDSLKIDENNLLSKIMKDAILSQIETFDQEIFEYEKLKKDKPHFINASFDKLPEILIKARIVSGLTQNDLAKKVGLKEQQIQRYESTDYDSASFGRILEIAQAMSIQFDNTKARVREEIINVDGYDSKFLLCATKKLHAKKELISI